MKVVIEFECENASFEDDFEDAVQHALSQACNKILAQHERTPATVCNTPEALDKLLDINGNTIGKVRLQET